MTTFNLLQAITYDKVFLPLSRDGETSSFLSESDGEACLSNSVHIYITHKLACAPIHACIRQFCSPRHCGTFLPRTRMNPNLLHYHS